MSTEPPPPARGRVTLDHIVILVPHSYISSLDSNTSSSPDTAAAGGGGDGGAPEWFRDLFTYSPGGRHSDGLTENVLVLLKDGVYLEFIAFTPGTGKQERSEHKWGGFVEGSVVDWAVTVFHAADGGGGGEGGGEGGKKGLAQRDYDEFVKPVTDKILQRHADHDQQQRHDGQTSDPTAAVVVYGDLIPGGRTRPDGVELEWAVVPAVRIWPSSSTAATPAGGGGADGVDADADADAGAGDGQKKTDPEPIRPGRAPFWCLDETPRERRVPYRLAQGDAGSGFTEHENSGAVGVAGIKVSSADGVGVDALGRLFGEVFGGEGGGKWPLPAPEGERHHSDGSLEIVEGRDGAGEEESIVVSLYTDQSGLVGKKVGGPVEGGKEIWFELVGV